MEKKEKSKQTLPEGLKRYYTKEAGEWGSIIDSLMSEDKAKLALSLMYGEPLYTQGELDKAREEAFTKEEWSVIANKFGLCCEERGYYEGDRELERRLDELSKLKQ